MRATTARNAARATALASALTFALTLTLTLSACDGPGIASPRRVTIATTGTGTGALSVVGSWRRVVFFIDDFGLSRSSETTWQFGRDGTAVRVQVARNYSYGLADVLVSAGRYRMEGTRVIIDLTSPSTTQLSYDVRRTGDQLEIAGQLYLLVTS
ncbi:MAG: hypothetical protein IT359_03510 [Gemmatimonadaceae bacterium]|nr:hypothetical protein [Gemmatimonadaceae bacterium]